MRIRNKLATAGVVTLLAVAGHQALAATDGTLGATSTGTSDVSLTINQSYQISGVSDLALGAWSGTGDLSGNDDVCVYTNDASAGYQVNITNSTGSFTVANAGATASVPFAVKWNSTTGTSGNQAVTYNSPLAGTGANTSSTNCGGGNDANFEVSVLAADLSAAPADSYSSTLSITIEP